MREVAGSRNFCLEVILCFIALFAELVPIFSANTGEYGDAYYFNISLHFGYYIYATPLVCAFASRCILQRLEASVKVRTGVSIRPVAEDDAGRRAGAVSGRIAVWRGVRGSVRAAKAAESS
ncbi:MAG: hypothetical protein ACLVJ6_15185 [Merdibacter sp.]